MAERHTPAVHPDTLTVDQLLDVIDGLDVTLPVRLEVLGDRIDIEGVEIHEGELRIVGVEVVDTSDRAPCATCGGHGQFYDSPAMSRLVPCPGCRECTEVVE